jgi:hypothetical protein
LNKLMNLETPYPSTSKTSNMSNVTIDEKSDNRPQASSPLLHNAPRQSFSTSFNLSDYSNYTPSPYATTIKKKDIRTGDEVIFNEAIGKSIVRRNLENFYLDDDDENSSEDEDGSHLVHSKSVKTTDVSKIQGSGRKSKTIDKNKIIVRWAKLPRK